MDQMDEASWLRTGPVPWLITHRPEPHPVAGGLSFGAGLLHQPVEALGVAGLLAAWLTSSIAPPAAAAGAGPVRVGFALGQTESSLVVVGTEDTVSAALRQAGRLLDPSREDPAGAAVDGGLRDRSRGYPNPLQPWRAHLAARWPGHPPHLSALGPLALDSLDGADLRRYVTRHAAVAARVYWTNEPAVAERVAADLAAGTGAATALAAPAGWQGWPGCVVRRRASELFSVTLPGGIATELALALLLHGLRRRTVEVEQLATGVRVGRYEVGGNTVIACVDADPVPGRDAEARATAVATLADLAAGAVTADEIARVRRWYADTERAVPLPEPATMAALARRQLRHGDFPTPATVAAACERTTDEQVRGALADSYRQLLLAVPAAEAGGQPPFPMAERTTPRRAEGRRFRDRIGTGGMARCSARRIGTVEAGQNSTTVDFDEVVLRLEAGDQQTTLVDRQLASVRLVWTSYYRADELRAIVDRRTPAVPVIQLPPDPEWQRRLAGALRRQRRRTVATTAGLIGFLVTLFAVFAVAEALA